MQSETETCTCDDLPVPAAFPDGSTYLDPFRTTDRVLDAVRDGRMVLLRADCPLEETNRIFESDTRYTLMHFLRCTVCGRTVQYGLCIRGLPIYRHVHADEPVERRWERSATFVDALGAPVRWHGAP
ncbi:hypothetical protein ACFUMH_12820 [Cellulomonas sp. NPDC057328]|uniref:hypothetical protein n=1 Tax=Cellulomonas sp. NPDC057328 TaxID=3346101 RepID=UPI003632F46D